MYRLDDAQAALAQFAQEHPSLSGPAALLREVLPLLFTDHCVASLALGETAALEKLRHSYPLFRGDTVRTDPGHLRRRWTIVCEAISRHQSLSNAETLAEAVRCGGLPIDELLFGVLDLQDDALAERAAAIEVSADLLMSALRLTLLPVLAAAREACSPRVAKQRWHRGLCAWCGRRPMLAELRGLEQLRYLRCGWCAADWEFPRLCCPFCETRDHQQLGYFEIEGQTKQRAATCDNCRGYLKTMFTLSALDPPSLLVADLTSMHLDLAAAEREFVG